VDFMVFLSLALDRFLYYMFLHVSCDVPDFFRFWRLRWLFHDVDYSWFRYVGDPLLYFTSTFFGYVYDPTWFPILLSFTTFRATESWSWMWSFYIFRFSFLGGAILSTVRFLLECKVLNGVLGSVGHFVPSRIIAFLLFLDDHFNLLLGERYREIRFFENTVQGGFLQILTWGTVK
jgi:hypothetical protein